MNLKLQPDIDTLTRMDLQEYLKVTRYKRLTAAMVYFQGQNDRLQQSVDKVDRRLVSKYETLGRRIETVDKAIASLEKIIADIDEIKGKRDQFVGDMVMMDTERGDEDL